MNPHELDLMAMRVIRGDYGDGNVRRMLLEDQGYNYDEIQNRVNEIMPEYTQDPNKYADLVRERNEPVETQETSEPTPEQEAEQGDRAEVGGKKKESIEAHKEDKAKEVTEHQKYDPDKATVETYDPDKAAVIKKEEPAQKKTGRLDIRKLRQDMEKYRDDCIAAGDGAEIKINGKSLSQEEALKEASNANKAIAELNKGRGEKKDWKIIADFSKDKLGKPLDDYRGEPVAQKETTKAAKEMDSAFDKDKKLSKEEKDLIKQSTQYDKKPAEFGDKTPSIGETKKIISEKIESTTDSLKHMFYNGVISSDELQAVTKSLDNIKDSMDKLQNIESEAMKSLKEGYSSAIDQLDGLTKSIQGLKTRDAEKVEKTVENIKEAKQEIKDNVKEAVDSIKDQTDLVKNAAVNTVDGISGLINGFKEKAGAMLDTSRANKLVRSVFQKENAYHETLIKNNANALDKASKALNKMNDKIEHFMHKYEKILENTQKNSIIGRLLNHKMDNFRNKTIDLSNKVQRLEKLVDANSRDYKARIDEQVKTLKDVQSHRMDVGLDQSKKLNRSIDNLESSKEKAAVKASQDRAAQALQKFEALEL